MSKKNVTPKPKENPRYLSKGDFSDAVASALLLADRPFSTGPACGITRYDQTVFGRTH